jgi:hypothetical protein
MKPTNLLITALSTDQYSKEGADFSVTEILKPPQLTYLAQKHESRAMPIYKGYMSLLGTAVHAHLETIAPKDAVVEKRFYHEFIIDGEKYTLGGKPDFIHNGILNDYKLVLVNGRPKDGKPKQDHINQAYINAWLANMNGVNVNSAYVEYWFRDWSPGLAENQSTYPQHPNEQLLVNTSPFNMEVIEAFIVERLQLHVRAKNGINTPCTDEEMWKKPDTWALKKPRNKRARKLCHSSAEALKEQKQGEEIEFRRGGCIRCESWCEYSHVCPQHNNNKIFT